MVTLIPPLSSADSGRLPRFACFMSRVSTRLDPTLYCEPDDNFIWTIFFNFPSKLDVTAVPRDKNENINFQFAEMMEYLLEFPLIPFASKNIFTAHHREEALDWTFPHFCSRKVFDGILINFWNFLYRDMVHVVWPLNSATRMHIAFISIRQKFLIFGSLNIGNSLWRHERTFSASQFKQTISRYLVLPVQQYSIHLHMNMKRIRIRWIIVIVVALCAAGLPAFSQWENLTKIHNQNWTRQLFVVIGRKDEERCNSNDKRTTNWM